jgi:general secretion pathway protein H
LTLIELMVVVVLLALFTGAVVMGMGAATNARVRSAATLIASGVRVAFSRSASNSRSLRLVFDFERNVLVLEESSMPMLVRRDDETRTDGAEATTQQEQAAIQEAARITAGPRAPRPLFQPVRALGFELDDPSSGRDLGAGVGFRRIEVAHAQEPYTSGRAYLYFWPGGMTERAAIQVGPKSATNDDRVITVLVSPLTGRVEMAGGAKPMPRPREDSEREDRGH